MNAFGSLNLAIKYAIIFGILLVVVLIAGFIKLWASKRRIRRYTQRRQDEDASPRDARGVQGRANAVELDAGNLFGIRALEGGYFGGVYQSSPTSPVDPPVASSPSS
ncbi:MAG: hypothetical protein M1825_001342 [Sarcosagium campestre]|nr:MAG: hypothetical protein M1825_001342 [Sarcosagium campestre]